MESKTTVNTEKKPRQPRWQRITLLIVLAYEGLGALLGGILLILEPDGRLMDMPVDIMHGAFPDFLVPGVILFCLGILNIIAFVTVLRNSPIDWIWAGFAMGGLLIWFIVEIIILEQLHWLHAMWGLPVVLGCLMVISLIPRNRHPRFSPLGQMPDTGSHPAN